MDKRRPWSTPDTSVRSFLPRLLVWTLLTYVVIVLIVTGCADMLSWKLEDRPLFHDVNRFISGAVQVGVSISLALALRKAIRASQSDD